MQVEDKSINAFTYFSNHSCKNKCILKPNEKTEDSIVANCKSDSAKFEIYTGNTKLESDQDPLQSGGDEGNFLREVGEELDNQEELKFCSDPLSSGTLTTTFVGSQTIENLDPDTLYGVISNESSDFPDFFAYIRFKPPGLVAHPVTTFSENGGQLQRALGNPEITRAILSKLNVDESDKQVDMTLNASSLTLKPASSGLLKENAKQDFHNLTDSSRKFIVLVTKTSKQSQRKHMCKTTLCSVCGKQISNVYWSQHVKVHTRKEKQYECHICGKRFYTYDVRKRHIKIHSRKKEYICSVCNLGCTTKYGLNLHLHTHSKQYTCPVCNNGCSTKKSLKKHLLSHNKERGYRCSTCKRSFSSLFVLRYHSIRYKEENPFSCTLCRTSYCSEEILENHWTLHNDGKLFVCAHCHRTFRYKTHFREHIDMHLKQSSLP